MSEKIIERVLKKYKVIAIVGLSRNSEKTSNQVAKYMQENGYKIVPINPTANEILGQKAYKSLLQVPIEVQKKIEIVDIFRPSDYVLPIVDQAILLRRKYGVPYVIWMQLGIENLQAAEKAKKSGLTVIMNHCVMREHGRLFGEKDEELEKLREKKLRNLMGKAVGNSAPIKVSDNSFDETIKKYRLILLDCWAPWCSPCQMLVPIIDELAKELAGKVAFGKLNVDENPETAKRFNIMGIPTLLVFKDGQVVDRIVGAVPKQQIESKLKQHFQAGV